MKKYSGEVLIIDSSICEEVQIVKKKYRIHDIGVPTGHHDGNQTSRCWSITSAPVAAAFLAAAPVTGALLLLSWLLIPWLLLRWLHSSVPDPPDPRVFWPPDPQVRGMDPDPSIIMYK